MHGKLKRDKIKRRESLQGWGITVFGAVMAFGLAWAADERGIPKKWVTAALATIFPFAFVLYVRRHDGPRRWAFWASMAICLAVHAVVVGMFFQYVLADVRTFSIWFWFPIMLVEMFALIIAVKRIEDKLTGRRETVKLSL
jgi:hypothetical protein